MMKKAEAENIIEMLEIAIRKEEPSTLKTTIELIIGQMKEKIRNIG